MNRINPPSFLTIWVILGALLVAGCLLLFTLISIGWTTARQAPHQGFVPANLTIIPPSTSTLSPTTVPTPEMTSTPVGQIGVGSYVQITGTQGAGLRIRKDAGQNGDTVFVAEEEEVFLVKDGPKQADGYTWWYLVAKYDSTRVGWAAADFLAGVPGP